MKILSYVFILIGGGFWLASWKTILGIITMDCHDYRKRVIRTYFFAVLSLIFIVASCVMDDLRLGRY